MSEPNGVEFHEHANPTEVSKGFIANLKEKTLGILGNSSTSTLLSGIAGVLAQAEIPNPHLQTALTAGFTTMEMYKNKTALAHVANDMVSSLQDPNRATLALAAADTVVNYQLPPNLQLAAAGAVAELSVLREVGIKVKSIIPHRNVSPTQKSDG